MAGLAAALRRLLAAFFRERCVACRAWGDRPLCAPCAAAWPAPVRGAAPPDGLDGVVAGAPYAGPVRAAVHALKFGRRARVAPILAAGLADHPGLPDAEWLLVPVPLHRLRRLRRGYNQAALLAGAIAARRGHRVAPVLRRVRPTRAQARLRGGDRAANVRGAFACAPLPPGACVVLVDDVLSTGATAAACADALRAAGACAVVVAVAAWTPKRHGRYAA